MYEWLTDSQKETLRKKWENIHPFLVQQMIKKWGNNAVTVDTWEEFMEQFKALTIDEKFELVLWWTAFKWI